MMRTARWVSRVLALFAVIAAIETVRAPSSQTLRTSVLESMIAASAFAWITERLTHRLRRPWPAVATIFLGPLLIVTMDLLSQPSGSGAGWLVITAGSVVGFWAVLVGRLWAPPPALLDPAQHRDLHLALREMGAPKALRDGKPHSSNDAPK